MGTRGEEEDRFSDAREEVSSLSDCNSNSDGFVEATGDMDLWTSNPESVTNRRQKFFLSMGFSFKKRDVDLDLGIDIDPPVDNLVTVSQPPLNSVSETNDVSESDDDEEEEQEEEEEKLLRNESISSSVSSSTDDKTIVFSRDYSSNSSSNFTSEGLSDSGSSSYGDFLNSPKKGGILKTGWLKKLGVLTHILDGGDQSLGSSTMKRQLTRVQSFKKQYKELSSLCIGQEFTAHEGSILVMKFSHDGNHLATAGEDSVVRVWSITQDERIHNQFEDSTCVCFGVNENSHIEPLNIDQEKSSRGLLRKKSESKTCAVLPSKVFRISEAPVHQFRGHLGEILDLTWSQKGFLLSSSVDETVRLWKLGSSSDECIRVFSHKSFVTCVAFNPVDDNYFISGSTDGKLRLWDVSRVRVIDYKDIREIVTTVCYRLDGNGVVVGSMTGVCRFYHTTDNVLELDREISLHGKKKVPSKRITGFQFFTGDSDKLMVTSADSQIRIISGVDTICKLKKASSLRTTLSPTSALFTPDGKHIVSTIEESGIHVWDYPEPNMKSSSQKPKTIKSYEGFLSDNVSVAIPWVGQGKEEDSVCSFITDLEKKFAHFHLPLDCISPLKGASTWPEEKLGVVAGAAAAAITAAASNRSKLRLLRSVCQNIKASTPHLWGLVIVTATWDGRIRVFHNYGLPIRV